MNIKIYEPEKTLEYAAPKSPATVHWYNHNNIFVIYMYMQQSL